MRNIKISKSKIGSKNPMWKGDKVGYASLHEWMERNLKKPKRCPICKESKPLELSNKNHTYRRILSDWTWLCERCHKRIDTILTWRIKNKQWQKKCVRCGEWYYKKDYYQRKNTAWLPWCKRCTKIELLKLKKGNGDDGRHERKKRSRNL